ARARLPGTAKPTGADDAGACNQAADVTSYFRPQPALPLPAGARLFCRGACMRTVVIALATIAVLAAPAYAQRHGKGGKNAASNQQSEQQKKKASAAEKDYKSALDKIPNKPAADPWGGMR